MSTIINIRGTHGAGKSTIMRNLIADLRMKKVSIIGQVCYVHEVSIDCVPRRIAILGNYEAVCGGGDQVGSFDKIERYVTWLAHHYNVVLFEAALYSTVFKSSDDFARRRSETRTIFMRLNTPLEVCIERVKQRRVEAGNSKPFDPSGLTTKYKSVLSAQKRLTLAGHETRELPYQNAHDVMMRLLDEVLTDQVEAMDAEEVQA